MNEQQKRRECWLAAREKALRLGVVPRQTGLDAWVVRGENQFPYTVTRPDPTGERYACTCKAGQLGNVCYHQAAVANLPLERARRHAYRTYQGPGALRKAVR